MISHSQHGGKRAAALRRQLADMQEKARRLASAIIERQQALNRLEASAFLGVALQARRDEQK